MHQESVIRYWQAVELLQPQAVPKLTPRRHPHEAFLYNTPLRQPQLPWQPDSPLARETLPPKRVWRHTLFAYLYDSQEVAQYLKSAFGADQGYAEPQSRISALFALKVDQQGHWLEDSFVLSSEAWFLGRMLNGQDWTHGFEQAQASFNQSLRFELSQRIEPQDMQQLVQSVLESLGLTGRLGDSERAVLRWRCQPVSLKKPEPEDDPLNSFLLNDLVHVAEQVAANHSSTPLNQYLRRHDPQARAHLDQPAADEVVLHHLMPDAYADGCWPSNGHRGLVHSQQLAVNTILTTLADDSGLLGINGPPGTGKTTLLRDLIAAIVTRRADVLASLGRASDAFVKDGREVINLQNVAHQVYPLDARLFGHEIVIASSNNGAVENVTLELPQRDTVDASWLPDDAYFAEIAETLTRKPAWGLISGALGSKARRSAFVSGYFFDTQPPRTTPATAAANTTRAAPLAADATTETDDDDEADDAAGWADATEAASAAPTEATSADPAEAEPRRGLQHWLQQQAQANEGRSSTQRQLHWREAVADYLAAKDAAYQASKDARRVRRLVEDIQHILHSQAERQQALEHLEQQLSERQAHTQRLDSAEGQAARQALSACLHALEQHHQQQPTLWANLLSLWGAQRRWQTRQQLLDGQRRLAQIEFDRVSRQALQAQETRQALEQEAQALHQSLQRDDAKLQRQRRDATTLAAQAQATYLLDWLRDGVLSRTNAIELAEPWQLPGWREARAKVFLQALRLQQAFCSLEPLRVRANLRFVNELLGGARVQSLSPEAMRSAWATLFLVVPVLSSTFASFARSFASLQAGQIGWLLVDEAGQATPQAAVGALWRAQRAVLVGDPLQLKPIVTVADATLEHMRTHYQIEDHWLPTRQSAQTLADEATPWGRLAGPIANKVWTGLPLLVHRRCDFPMYALANRIAYDDAMVYGTVPVKPEQATPAPVATGWIDAPGPSEGNWVPAEGEALEHLLAVLCASGVALRDIAVITPFRAVMQRLRQQLPKRMVRGTIHTMQGKEAAVVILVLGGDANSPGARQWAVSEPNLLNVAVTRAKQRLYVIGDYEDWQHRALFCEVMEFLPRQVLPARPTRPNSSQTLAPETV